MKWNGLPILVFGCEGASRETREIIREINRNSYTNQFEFLGYISEDKSNINTRIGEDLIVTSDEEFENYIDEFPLIGVVIPIGTPIIKKKIYEKIKKYKNIIYPNIISPKANIIDKKIFSKCHGNVVAAGVIININVDLGNFNLLNMNSTIGHDCKLGEFCVINPLAAISGNVILEDLVIVGAGTAIKQGVVLKQNSTLGLGAFTVKNSYENQVLICNSAIDIKEKV